MEGYCFKNRAVKGLGRIADEERVCLAHFPQALEGRQGTLELFGRYAVGKAEMSGTAKGAAGHHQDVLLFCQLTENLFIAQRRLREEVESTLRFNTLKAQTGQVVVDAVAIVLVNADIHLHVEDAGNHLLKERRRIDKAEMRVATFKEERTAESWSIFGLTAM